VLQTVKDEKADEKKAEKKPEAEGREKDRGFTLSMFGCARVPTGAPE
jgi:hypothetical protein